ncbi:MAG: hypothetical protein GX335_02285, partial [Firmicutes bacterium]|nr:hypothetical protein [Bacillota bacterium]
MDSNQKDVINRIFVLLKTGREAVEYIITLNEQSPNASFPLALDTLEMLSSVQNALDSLSGCAWRDEALEALQTVVPLFSDLTDAYEEENEEKYYCKL